MNNYQLFPKVRRLREGAIIDNSIKTDSGRPSFPELYNTKQTETEREILQVTRILRANYCILQASFNENEKSKFSL